MQESFGVNEYLVKVSTLRSASYGSQSYKLTTLRLIVGGGLPRLRGPASASAARLWLAILG